ncbi:MAG: F0F1 ATP synthase subunit delta [Acidimicrobiia bacterium]
MLIDWFTIVAQLINFAILVVALKFLLYDRLSEAVAQRGRSIAEKERLAEERSQEAVEKSEELDRERRELDAQRDEILDKASREARDKRRQLLAEVREEVATQEKEWKESVRSRQDRLLTELQRLTGEKAVAISRRLLQDLTKASMEPALVEGLVEQIDALPPAERQAIAEGLGTNDRRILVQSAFELSDESRQRISEVVDELVGDPEEAIIWELEPDLIAGVVLQIGSQTVGWTMSGYLDELEREFADVLHSGIGKDHSSPNGQNPGIGRHDPGEGAEGHAMPHSEEK